MSPRSRRSYVFSAGLSPTLEIAATLRFFNNQGWTRVAFLTSTDASADEAEAGITAGMRAPENRALRDVAHERFNSSDLNMLAQVARIKAANPQAMIIWGAPNVLATAIRSISDGGLDIPTLVGDSSMVYSMMNQLSSYLPRQLYFTSNSWASVSNLPAGPQRTALVTATSLLLAAGIRPDAGTTQPWDAGSIVVNALRKLGPDASATAIRDYINALHGITGLWVRTISRWAISVDSTYAMS